MSINSFALVLCVMKNHVGPPDGRFIFNWALLCWNRRSRSKCLEVCSAAWGGAAAAVAKLRIV